MDPYTYLVDVLQRIERHPAPRAVELTPQGPGVIFGVDFSLAAFEL